MRKELGADKLVSSGKRIIIYSHDREVEILVMAKLMQMLEGYDQDFEEWDCLNLFHMQEL